MKSSPENQSLKTIVGYGTFITQKRWLDYTNVAVCLIKGFRRIFPPENWFPYVIPDKKSQFWGLKFDVNSSQLSNLDKYEGVRAGLYSRFNVKVVLKDKTEINAEMYVPTKKTINQQKLVLDIDNVDAWKLEIKKHKDIINKFPELII